MSQVGYVTLTGYVTSEPKLWHNGPALTPVAKIRVGSTPRRLDRRTGEWLDGETSYYTVKCWRKLAQNVASCLRKGDMVIVRGKFRTRTWVDDEQRTRSELEIEADSVGHDLAFGWSHFNRGAFTPQGAARRAAEGEAARQGVASDADLPDDPQFRTDSEDEEGALDQPADDEYPDQEPGLAPDAAEVAPDQLGQLAGAGTPF
jgi:single-strand DNA-binding protein